MRIFIDPGHGGADPGVDLFKPLVEKDLNLVVSKLVRERLENAGHTVAMARDDDRALRLSERGALSAKFQADLVISIHTNSNGSPDPRGLMTFYWPGNEKGQRVAESIAVACPESLKRRQAAYAATKEGWPRVRNVLTVHTATAVLVEVGFASNPKDRALLLDPGVQVAIADAIAWGSDLARDLTPVPRTASPAPAQSEPESHPSASEPLASASPAEPEAPSEEQRPRRRRRF